MPHSCAAWKCTKRCTVETRAQGVTFHRFPKDPELRTRWEAAVRREGFPAGPSSMLCSEHFRPEDFDRTGQTVRIRAGAVPSVSHLLAQRHRVPRKSVMSVRTRRTRTSRKALETPSLDSSQRVPVAEPLPLPLPLLSADHSYNLPSSNDDLKARLRDALARVETLERERRNAKDRERRAKSAVSGLLQDVRVKTRRKSVVF